MKNIIYNSKLKKFLTAILVVMILISYIMPKVVFADNDKDDEEKNKGGILLPVTFALINFVADAITGTVGGLMNDEGLSLGIDVLTPTIPAATAPQDITIDANDFDTAGEGYEYPNIKYTPEEIFAGKVDILSIDFISGKNSEGEVITGEWASIRSVIASWYKVLRMVAIIGLLSVLIYTGIKIIISSNAKDKAKYKEWIINWFIAVAILFSMHYIMSFVNSVIREFNSLLMQSSGEIVVKIENGANGSVSDGAEEYFSTNLMGLVRFMVQSAEPMVEIGYEAMYIALIFYTIKFTIIYLKRVLSMAFLTLIAPIVALTYPIDKLNDGNAQGFNMWIKEYIFNALLQPMHLIMYYILLGSAVSIAAKNPIYGIVVLAFMTEAEKLLKKIFGFDKASGGTVGGMAGAFAAGALASSVKDIARMAKLGGGNGNKVPNSGVQKNDAIDAPKANHRPGMDTFDEDDGAEAASSGGENNREQADASSQEADLASERRVLEQFKAENPTGGDRTAYEELERELEEKEAQQRQRESTQAQSAETSAEQDSTNTASADKGTPIRTMAGRVGRGLGSVGKRILKPAWDLDHKGWAGAKYNLKRLGIKTAKGLAKGVGGATLGIAAATVQAGISITDGKYNPMEGLATIGAGFAGASGIVDKVSGGMGSLIDTYKDGAYAGDKDKQMERAQKRFPDRQDVIDFNKKEYAGKEQKYMKRERDNYLPAGVSDLKDMKRCMKYANALVGDPEKATEEQMKKADRKAAATLDFKKRLQDQGQLAAVYDKDKQDKYIKQMVEEAKRNGQDAAKTEKQYRNAFKSIVAFDAANA